MSRLQYDAYCGGTSVEKSHVYSPDEEIPLVNRYIYPAYIMPSVQCPVIV